MAVSAIVRAVAADKSLRARSCALAGVANAIGLITFYRALALGRMSIVAPVVGMSALLPVVVGLLSGERPSLLQSAGIAIGIVGIVLASRELDHEVVDLEGAPGDPDPDRPFPGDAATVLRRSAGHGPLYRRTYRVEVDLWSTSHVFRPGHRLRVLVTASDFPRYDRCPGTGEGSATATRIVPQRNRLFCDAARPSHLEVPHVPASVRA